jgi:hypothetical protein
MVSNLIWGRKEMGKINARFACQAEKYLKDKSILLAEGKDT